MTLAALKVDDAAGAIDGRRAGAGGTENEEDNGVKGEASVIEPDLDSGRLLSIKRPNWKMKNKKYINFGCAGVNKIGVASIYHLKRFLTSIFAKIIDFVSQDHVYFPGHAQNLIDCIDGTVLT